MPINHFYEVILRRAIIGSGNIGGNYGLEDVDFNKLHFEIYCIGVVKTWKHVFGRTTDICHCN